MGLTIWGGKLVPQLELSISGQLPVSAADVSRNEKHSASLGLKTYRNAKAGSPYLAVVGGGPSIEDHIDELRAWDGDVWAINGALAWCRDNCIEATFIACDPHPIVAKWAAGAKKALLETRCDPSVFALLRDADVTLFDIGDGVGSLRAAGSTITAVPHLACRMGYRGVVIYGCESCYTLTTTHAYQKEKRDEEMIVDCGGTEFLTAPDFYMQAVELSEYIKQVPGFLKERSGGLLRAMMETGSRGDIRWVSDGLARTLTPVAKTAHVENGAARQPLDWDG